MYIHTWSMRYTCMHTQYENKHNAGAIANEVAKDTSTALLSCGACLHLTFTYHKSLLAGAGDPFCAPDVTLMEITSDLDDLPMSFPSKLLGCPSPIDDIWKSSKLQPAETPAISCYFGAKPLPLESFHCTLGAATNSLAHTFSHAKMLPC